MAGRLGLTAVALVVLVGFLAAAEPMNAAEVEEMRLTKLAYRQFVLAGAPAALLSEAEEMLAEKRAFVAALGARGRLDGAIDEAEELRQVKGAYRRYLAEQGRGETFAGARP